MELIVRPHLLSSREAERYDLPEGTSIADMVAVRSWPAGVEAHLCALVNGVMVPREWWARVKPRAGASVTLAVRLQGGGGQGGGKMILRLVAVVVVAIFAQWAGPALAGYMGAGAMAGNLITAGIMLVGNLAINAIFKPATVSTTPSGDTSNAYSFQGQSNSVRPYGVVPRVLGTHRMYPDVVANPYTQLVGDDQYLLCIYSFGYGPVDLNDICIGENPIEQYEPQISVHKEFRAGDKLDIYLNDMVQDGFALQLEHNVGTIVTTRPETDAGSVDLTFSTGLGYLNNSGGIDGRQAFTKIEYKRESEPDTAWKNYTEAPGFTLSEGNKPKVVAIPMVNYYDQNEYLTLYGIMQGETTFWVSWPENIPPAAGSWIEIAGHRYTIIYADASYLSISPGIVETYVATAHWPENGTIAGYYSGSTNSIWEVTRAKGTPFTVSFTLRFPDPDSWQIRLTQLEPDSTDLKYLHKRSITALRSEKNIPPLAPDKPTTILEIKIRATDQLSGVIQNLNALATAHLKQWNGSEWIVGPTSNPAWQYLELLQGPANKRKVPDSRIDFDALKAWAVRNDTVQPGFTQKNSQCNFIVDKSYTLWELLSSVAANGRAMPTMRDNRYSVIVDEQDKTPVQVFTPRNSWGLTASRKYIDMPDALRVKWIDPALGYIENQTIVYNDGFDASNATNFEELATFGITSYEQAYREGRVALARGRLQQEEFTISADVENIICLRGDLIGIAHDVLEVGGWSARLASISGERVTFDADLKPFDGPWGARVRTDDGVISPPLAMELPPPPGEPGVYVIQGLPANAKVGDLVVYGTVSTVLGQYLVKGVTPGDDLTAQIACIEYAPGVYEAELGDIPPYVPQGGSIGSIAPGPVQGLAIHVRTYTTDRYPRADVSLSWNPPAGTSVRPSLYVISEVREDGTIAEVGRTDGLTFTPLTNAPRWTTPYGNTTVRYEVAAQWPGVRGAGTQVSALIPIAVPDPLPALTGAVAAPFARGVAVSWNASNSADTAFYVVRYGPAGATWESAAATEQKIKANHLDLPATFLVGNYQAMVSQEDVYSIRSAHIVAPFSITGPQAVNVVGTAVQNTAFLRWGTLVDSEDGQWSAQTTFQIEYYEVQKTRQSVVTLNPRRLANDQGIIPAGVTTRSASLYADQPQPLGKYSGEFAVLDEQQEGLWQYCIRGIDVAGNAAPFTCVTLLVQAPDDYFLLDELADFVNLPETTKTNAIKTLAGSWLAPLDVTSSWAKHFEDEGWDQPSDQVAAGFPMYAQPAEGKAVFSWSHDYGQNLPSLMVSAEVRFTEYDGDPDVVLVAYAKANAGDAWVELARGPVAIVSLLPPGTRFVRVDIEVTTDAARRALAFIEAGQYRLDVRFRDDAGTVTTPGSGSAVVTFNVPFLDVRSVQLTSADPNVAYARYQVASDQRSMTVYTFNSSGAPVGGKVAWMARGI